MPFHCTLVRGPFSAVRQEAVELTVEIDDGGPGAAVQAAVAVGFGTGELTVCGRPLSSLAVGRPPLLPGAVLVDGGGTDGPVPGARPSASTGLHLLVHSGPGAGVVVPLERGRYSIGRGNCSIPVADPEMSRLHAVLTVSETSVSLRDGGSSNGTKVNGRRIRTAVVSTDSLILCGTSLMTIVFDSSARASTLEAAGTTTGSPLRVPHRPSPAGRLNLLLMAGLPLLLGLVLAITTGTWMFLAFTGISAVALLVPLASGRKERRTFKSALQAAVSNDTERRQRAAPSAAEIVLAASSGPAGQSGPGQTSEHASETRDPGGVGLRIGTGHQAARIELDPQDPAFSAPVLRHAPVTLDPSLRDITVAGPQAKTAGLFNFLLMQLAAYPSAASFPVVVMGPAGLLPLSARFLPKTVLHSDRDAAQKAVSGSAGAGFLFLPEPLERSDAPLLEAALAAGWTVFRRLENTDHCATIDHRATNDHRATIELGHGAALLRCGESRLSFDADLVAADVFDSFCRLIGTSTPPTKGTARTLTGLPGRCSLADLVPWDPPSILGRWQESKESKALQAVIGRGTQGTRSLDLVDDGPHLLIAGTTGAGKSELLRTIVTSLSLAHSPERVTFLFVDFKGGSGLGPLAALPHCVGLLTDLKQRGVDRTLASLRAEIRWREGLLAAAGVEDLASYRMEARRQNQDSPGRRTRYRPLPWLVVVVDEFRMLIEDSPSALAELMRIATVGRSLGIHLIMATQRPQGAISSDIRANVTTSIALRVQSEMESRDVINSPLAAAIPISMPGRAYLSRGVEECELFQTASLSGAAENTPARTVIAQEAVLALEKGAPKYRALESTTAGSGRSAGAEGAVDTGSAGTCAPAVEAIRTAWSGLEETQPRRPVAAELPESLLPEDAGGPDGRHATALPLAAFLGVVDLPDRQCTGPLFWHPALQGHLALLGPPGSGVEGACLAISSRLLLADHEVHCYVLDGDGSFPGTALPGRVGAIVTPQEPLRAVRVAERIAAEVAARQAGGGKHVPLLLVITAWGSWLALLRAGPLAWAEDLIHGISRDGPKSGIHLLVTGDRELTTSRLYGSLPNRAYFPCGSTEESRAAWPRFALPEPLTGRALVAGPYLGEGLAEAQFVVPSKEASWPYGKAAEPEHRAFRVQALPRRILPGDVVSRALPPVPRASNGATVPSVLLGLGGDELEPVVVSLPPGGVVLVLGHRGTGKSNFLDILPLLNPDIHWLRAPSGSDPAGFCAELHGIAGAGFLAPGGIALIDDVDRLGSEAADLAAALPSLGVSVIATAAYGEPFIQRLPLASQARNEGRGILLSPRHPADGDLFGFRVEAGPNVPGRAVLIQDGESQTFQIPVAEPGRVAA
ncbi:FtsK/SpoIIIE domain-containing protein [Arthrobacter cupressi]|uniref:DNA segregation ATPase FtsK/SpoIIIE, S-DNA-T family n=1 Tax=Arthrobacter cupressi TaxID=1045773 RepID=A0A1G8P0Y3_9MICC|nr:FtsK/SpoIIIE domain-containing protein [Arthrobacter cupressi]NYD76692.1 S-DNA-T family DNA segregation ATPase FtsK/SpoIIIE [Arthrobacter cupressi]SDI86194.1 DNA segregation ATPase FtsK/SpoIIIE, S-DNA-T family [Arthrobacter cupressi]